MLLVLIRPDRLWRYAGAAIARGYGSRLSARSLVSASFSLRLSLRLHLADDSIRAPTTDDWRWQSLQYVSWKGFGGR